MDNIIVCVNEHLRPVFAILRYLEKSGVDYWVYGGVGIAGYAGKFKRENKDIDIFVRDEQFEETKNLLNIFCVKNGYSLINQEPLSNGRPKLDIKINRIERLSVIPVYVQNGKVLLKFHASQQDYDIGMLQKVKRNVSGYEFYTPPDEFIKKLFANYGSAREYNKKNLKLNMDAKTLFPS